jgi:CHASE2 domain-containing sensor protein
MPSDVPGDDAKASDVRAGPGAAREEGNSVAAVPAVPAVAVSEVAEAAAIANRAGVQPPIGSSPPVINVAIPVAALPVTITVRAPDEVSASTAAEPEPERNGWQHLIQPMLAMLVLLIAMATDVFGLRTATGYASRDAFIKFYSLWYGRPHISDDIVVFTFRDEDLERTDANYRGLAEGDCSAEYTTWPLAYSDRLCMLNALVAAKPAAIFFDVLFAAGELNDEKFIEFNRRLSELASDEQVPILLADVPTPEGEPSVVHPDIRATGVQFVLASWQSATEAYPLWVDPRNGCARETPASPMWLAPDARQEQETEVCESSSSSRLVGYRMAKETPATALYRIHERRRNPEAGSLDTLPVGPPMRVIWGFDPPPTRHGAVTCAQANAQTKWNIVELAFAGPKASKREWLQPTDCLFHRDLPGNTLLRWADSNQLADNVAGKYVFIGASLAGMPDSWASPVHGSVPAVHLHAMAFDNLVHWQGHPLRDPLPAFVDDGMFAWSDVTELALLFGISVSIVWWRRRPAYRGASMWGRAWRLGLALLVFLWLVITCSVVLLIFGRMVPVNWIALLTMALAATIPSAASIGDVLAGLRDRVLRGIGIWKSVLRQRRT